MKSLQSRLTYANVVATLALFVAVGGASAFAASQLGKNSVGTKQLKSNSVTTAKIKKNAVTGGKVKKQTLTGSDINLSKLGTVPSAQTANSIPPAEPTHLIGAPGEPPFEAGASNVGGPAPGVTLPPGGFYKDHEGIVHLEGFVKAGTGSAIFTLPPGYRPGPGQLRQYEPIGENFVVVSGADTGIFHPGSVLGSSGSAVSLEGISFRPGA
jgi:hypothetical protein